MKYLITCLIGLFSFTVYGQNQEEKRLNQLMDAWHLAAANADSAGFFGKMSVKGVYLGTDPSERWIRDDLALWSREAFARESAWTFSATERNWARIDDSLAFGDELLKTWMGPCRASFILVKERGEWLITQYHLALTMENESMDEFLEIKRP